MKLIRSERRGIKIHHNKKLFWVIIILLILLGILLYFIVQSDKSVQENNNESKRVVNGNNNGPVQENDNESKGVVNGNNKPVVECIENSDCVPGTCCHADFCVSKEKIPDCREILCTMDCSGPLDCGAGRCGCVENKCEIIN
jgi:hypothetical protein